MWLVPGCYFDERPSLIVEREAAQNMADQIGIDPTTPEIREDVEIKQMYIVGTQDIVMRLYSIAPQGPAKPCEAALDFDEPQMSSPAKPLREFLSHDLRTPIRRQFTQLVRSQIGPLAFFVNGG